MNSGNSGMSGMLRISGETDRTKCHTFSKPQDRDDLNDGNFMNGRDFGNFRNVGNVKNFRNVRTE